MTRYELSDGAEGYSVEVGGSDDDLLVSIGGRKFTVRVRPKEAGTYSVTLDGKPITVKVEEISPQSVRIAFNGETMTFRRSLAGRTPARQEGRAPLSPADAVTAPMPGRIISVLVKSGQRLKEGDTVAIIESMKMESAIKSPRNGEVSEVLAKEGASVKRGELLVRFRRG